MALLKCLTSRVRRFRHHPFVDFRVGRQNHEVAAAFRDPILDGPGILSSAATQLRALGR